MRNLFSREFRITKKGRKNAIPKLIDAVQLEIIEHQHFDLSNSVFFCLCVSHVVVVLVMAVGHWSNWHLFVEPELAVVFVSMILRLSFLARRLQSDKRNSYFQRHLKINVLWLVLDFLKVLFSLVLMTFSGRYIRTAILFKFSR